MKLKHLLKPANILNRFGQAWLIRNADGKHELVGGTDRDCTEAKEWISLFAHDIIFTRPVKPRSSPGTILGNRSGYRHA